MWRPILLLLASVSMASAVEVSPAELLAKMQKTYDTIDSFKATFSQSYQSRRFSDKIQEKGVVYFKKGGLMRWEYRQPERKIFVSDGQYYYYYVPEDKQVVKVPANQKMDQRSPTLFLAGRGNFQRDFKVSWADPRQGSHLLKLTPTSPQTDFDHLVVQVDPVQGFILRLLVVDAYDNRTEYTFHNIQENPPLPPQFFAFKAPPGTDVVFQRPENEE
jgi:outer membrane lipoprotein carrier protein